MLFRVTTVAISLLISLPLALHALPGYVEPWGKDADLNAPRKAAVEKPKASLAVRMAEQAILFHQNVITQVDGPRSHFRPSSSAYMRQAMQRHGFIKGFLMGCDRLLRENDSPWVYRTIEVDGKLYKHDPPH